MTTTPEERKTICEAIREGEEIAKRITELVTKLKPFLELDAQSKSDVPATLEHSDPDSREEEPQSIIANELKSY